MEKFTLYRIDDWSNIFLVIPKENEELPLIVHCILKVEGESYEDSFYEFNSFSEDLLISGELDRLGEEAKRDYFKVD